MPNTISQKLQTLPPSKQVEVSYFVDYLASLSLAWSPRQALEIVRSGRCALVSADAAIEEFVRVLGYRKFGLSPEEITPLVHDLLSLSTRE